METQVWRYEASDLKRVKDLEAENAWLKRMCVDLALENMAMKDLIEKTLGSPAKRESAEYLISDHNLSVAQACRYVGLSRSAYCRVRAHWTVSDADSIAALATLVEGRPSRECWKCRKILRRQGRSWNHKRIYRVYKQLKLHRRRPAKRRLPKRHRVELYLPKLPDTGWSADFVSDALYNGRRFRTFNVVDDFNREVLHIAIDASITSECLVWGFEPIRAQHGLPQVLRTDNGSEFLGAFTSWAKNADIAIQYIQPGKPNQTAYIERFNRTCREEVLDQHLFASLDDVREATYWWMIEPNEERSHDSLGDLTPQEARIRARKSTFYLSLIWGSSRHSAS